MEKTKKKTKSVTDLGGPVTDLGMLCCGDRAIVHGILDLFQVPWMSHIALNMLGVMSTYYGV